jgi:6-phosphofructokinase 1
MTVMGIYRGYNGLIHGEVKELHVRSVSDIIQRGGTILYTARCDEFRHKEGILKGVETCNKHGIEGVVVIGGDGSFRGAADLSAYGIPCIGIPGTIDNDINSTGYTIGYDTAMNTAMELIDKLRDTAQSHDRCSVVEVMGHNAGYIALNTGIACGATFIITKEMPYSVEEITDKIKSTQTNQKHHFIIVVSEGIGGSEELAKQIERETGVESRATILGHVQRGGSPTLRDRVVASQLGYKAVELLSEGKGNRVVGIQRNKIVDFDIKESLTMKKEFDRELYDIASTISF